MSGSSAGVPFSFRVRFGGCEIEVCGSRDEVMQTIKELPGLVAGVVEAFGAVGVEAPSDAGKERASALPVVGGSASCSEAVLRLLGSDWGRAQPKSLPELVEALRANAVHYPASTLSGVLAWLVRRGRVKRWKTEKGYVYVSGESERACERPPIERGGMLEECRHG